jgi:uncharacterized protein (TIGR03435 family)
MQVRWARCSAAVVMAGLLCAGVAAWGQGAGADGVTKPQMMAADADLDWDVVSVRPSDPNNSRTTFEIRGRHVIAGNRSVETMLRVAYTLQENQVLNAPDWVKTERFDVDGIPSVEGQPSAKQFQALLRKMLTERFGLVAHTERRELPVYMLTVAKDGPKMTLDTSDPSGRPHDDDSSNAGQQTVQIWNTTMREFALVMLFYTDRPVVDETGLKDRYDLKLKWTFDEQKAPTDGSAAPSLFTAIQEETGLKLEQVKRMTDVLVVDKVERPGAN